MSDKPQLFIFGLGFSSVQIALEAKKHGFTVSGTTRSREKAEALGRSGIAAHLLPEAEAAREDLAAASHILSSIPPSEGSGEPQQAMRPDAWLGYLSTTGVYGDWQGAWVDEGDDTRPAGNARLIRRITAEKQWLSAGGHIFRLAGIYGPGRSAIENVIAGEASRIDKPGQVFSRTHVADIAQVVVASMMRPRPASIYNVCDDLPAPAHEVTHYACLLLGVEPPPLVPFAEAELSPMGREFYASNRRVRNDKIKHELGVQLRFPTYKEGLADCLARHLQKERVE